MRSIYNQLRHKFSYKTIRNSTVHFAIVPLMLTTSAYGQLPSRVTTYQDLVASFSNDETIFQSLESSNAQAPAEFEIINMMNNQAFMNFGLPFKDVCKKTGFPTETFKPGDGDSWGEVAGDFSVQTLLGTWQLSKNFSGCDNYIFVNDTGTEASEALRGSFDASLFERSPRNVHWFFLNTHEDPATGAWVWFSQISEIISSLDKEELSHWIQRIHFVTQTSDTISGSLGALFRNYPEARTAAINRFQTFDSPGVTRIPQIVDGQFAWVHYAPILAYTPRWYNFLHAQEQSLAAQDPYVTEVVLMDNVVFPPDGPPGENGPFANNFNNQVWTTTFPSAEVMAQFDTMEVVVTGKCGPSSAEDCGRWDYEAFVHWCETEACEEGTDHEVFRWITPYARAGERKWVFNTTPMLGLVKAGGEQYFRFGMRWNMNPSTWDMRFRLRNTGQVGVSSEVIPAFVGNQGFNDEYNDWAPMSFTPPTNAKKVEFVALISGHGQEEGNCAEWCEHQHEFTLNQSKVIVREFPGQVEDFRCAEAVDQGVVPGQGGNWTPGRAGWCPGLPVQPWIVDITNEVTLGAPNTLEYIGKFEGEPVTGSHGRILLSSYVVIYE